jgi:hypothetical protein
MTATQVAIRVGRSRLETGKTGERAELIVGGRSRVLHEAC